MLRAQTKGATWIIDNTSFEGQSHHCLKRENLRIWPMKKVRKCIRSGGGSASKYVKEVLRRWDPATEAERKRAVPSARSVQIRVYGAYIGEALHQFAGAEWRSDGPGDFHLEYQGSVIWSLDKAHDRIVNGDEDNVLHYAAVMLRRWCSEAGRSQFLVE